MYSSVANNFSIKCYFLYIRYIPGGTCAGDSGGPLLTSIEDLTTLELKTQQIAVLHGGLEKCSNVDFPAIYVRLDHPLIHKWLISQISENPTVQTQKGKV